MLAAVWVDLFGHRLHRYHCLPFHFRHDVSIEIDSTIRLLPQVSAEMVEAQCVAVFLLPVLGIVLLDRVVGQVNIIILQSFGGELSTRHPQVSFLEEKYIQVLV